MPNSISSPTTAAGVVMVCLWLCSLLHTLMRTSAVHCYVICVRCGELEWRVGGCVSVQYPVVGCDNVNMGAFSWQQCYKYPPTPLSKHKVMCTAHGPFFARLQYRSADSCSHKTLNSLYTTCFKVWCATCLPCRNTPNNNPWQTTWNSIFIFTFCPGYIDEM